MSPQPDHARCGLGQWFRNARPLRKTRLLVHDVSARHVDAGSAGEVPSIRQSETGARLARIRADSGSSGRVQVAGGLENRAHWFNGIVEVVGSIPISSTNNHEAFGPIR